MGQGYIYANGRVSALETSFLASRVWQSLLAARDDEEARRILADSHYGEFLQRAESTEEGFERVLAAGEDELMDLAEDPALVEGLLQRRDVRNARYLWKAALFEGGDVPVERAGRLEVELLRRAVDDEDARGELPGPFRETLEQLQAGGYDVLKVDRVMDALAARVERDHLALLEPRLAVWLQTRLEIRNLLTAGRVRQAGLGRSEVEAALLEGGFHAPEELALAYQLNELPGAVAAVPSGERLAPVFAEALADGSFLPFERESDALLMELLEELGAETFGPGRLAAFVLLREMEVAHLKLLLAGKAAGIPRERLQRRLPRGGRGAGGGA